MKVKVPAPAPRARRHVVTGCNVRYGRVTRGVADFRAAPDADRRAAARSRAREIRARAPTPTACVAAPHGTAQTRDGVTCVNERPFAGAQDGGTARA
jgi:hypothetical protein